jgi:hypothetical protein
MHGPDGMPNAARGLGFGFTGEVAWRMEQWSSCDLCFCRGYIGMNAAGHAVNQTPAPSPTSER